MCSAPGGQKRAIGSPETGVIDGCEPPSWCWKLNPGPLEEQPMLLTTEFSPPPIFSNKNDVKCKEKQDRTKQKTFQLF